ncbi:peroxisomal ATPase PEX1-like [Ptychodera flava]|uniref:peroxisomal ATPase PEX1-like n=1 Tax=Ptychodera flava TaxID=63121 RepID=UPI00396AA732
MSTIIVCSLEFNNVKSSFISLPAILAAEYQRVENASFELQWGDGSRVFVSWSGEVTRRGQNEMVVEINGLYANKLGLQHGQQVLLKPLSSIPACVTAHIEPVTVDDWEILELHAGYVESQLLSQLRIVWPGQVFPFWVNKNICIFLKTGSIEPMVAQYAKLEQYTEVVVAPKSRISERLDKPAKQQRSMLNSSGNKKSNSDLQRAAEDDSGKGTSVGQQAKREQIIEHGEGNETPQFMKTNKRLYDSYLENSALEWSLYPMWYASKLYNYFRSSAPLEEKNTQSKELEEEDASVSESAELNGVDLHGISIILRVHPMGDSATVTESLSRQSSYAHHMTQEALSRDSHVTRVGSDLTEGDIGDRYSHLMQPTTVYINRNTLIDSISDPKTQCQVELMTNTEYSSFLAVLVKLPSPKERMEEYRKKILESDDKTKKNTEQKSSEKKKQKEEAKVPSSFVVRVIVCNDEFKAPSDYPYPTVSMVTDYLSEDLVQVQDLFRRQLHLEVSSRVRLYGLRQAPSSVSSITLHPVSDLPKGIDHSEIIYAFQLWLACISCMMYPFPVNQGTLIRFPISRLEDHYGEFSITLHSSGEKLEMEYFLLHPFVARKVKITVAAKLSPQTKPPLVPSIPCNNISQLDPAVVGIRLRDLGGVNDLSRQALDHLKISLGIRPLANYICKPNRGLFNGGLLIYGPKGIGKSTLARSLSREVSEWPYLSHTTIIQCKQLKGKRVENIRKIWEEAFQEAFWRQPSVILLDGLDHVTSAPLGPEQELGPEAVYNTRVAQTLKDIILSSLSANHRVALIATSKSQKTIHSSLVATRGTHIFQNMVEMTPPNAVARKEILKSVIESKIEVDMRSIDAINMENFGLKTEGFVARDIVTVVERAIHTASGRKLYSNRCDVAMETEDESEEILLTNMDFTVALENFTPLSLLNVPLHSPGKLGWQDVGGLTEVKNILVETLELPAKYPGLFNSCPLRLRSGLLLYGPPGTGKTLLAGIVAKECGLRFISIKGPELLSKYIGASEQAVRDMFTRAQSAKPCILFFDEFDSLAPRRGHDSTGVTDRVVNQLLTQLDGVESLEGVYVLAATSRPDLIDPALLRPGRLDKCLYCPLPNKEERLEILQALSRYLDLDAEVQLETLAEKCEGFTGADFKALLYNAQLEAIHKAIGSENYAMSDDDMENDLETLEIARKMEANDWQLTFMEGNGENGFAALEKCPEEQQSFVRQMRESMQKHVLRRKKRQNVNGKFVQVGVDDQGNTTTNGKNMNEMTVGDETDSKLEELDFDDLQRVIYMPTVRDGTLDDIYEVPSKIIEEVNIIRENYYHQKHKIHETESEKTEKKEKKLVKITQEYLMNAATSMRPSVSEKEKLKYQIIYGNFVKSRGGDFGTSTPTGEKRTTLA